MLPTLSGRRTASGAYAAGLKEVFTDVSRSRGRCLLASATDSQRCEQNPDQVAAVIPSDPRGERDP